MNPVPTGRGTKVPRMEEENCTAKERRLDSLCSHVKEVAAIAHKIQCELNDRFYELTSEGCPPETASPDPESIIGQMHLNLDEITYILNQIRNNFTSL